MSKPPPTGRLNESQPEFQDFPIPLEAKREPLPRGGEAFSDFAEVSPGMWERLERRVMGLSRGAPLVFYGSRRSIGKSWLPKLYAARVKHLEEQRHFGQLAIRKAIAAFFASFKR